MSVARLAPWTAAVVCILLLGAAAAVRTSDVLVVSSLSRSLDASHSIVKESMRLKVENPSSVELSALSFYIPCDLFHHKMASFEASHKKAVLAAHSDGMCQRDVVRFDIALQNPVAAGASDEVNVKFIWIDVFVPTPAAIPQSQVQYVSLATPLVWPTAPSAGSASWEKQILRIRTGTEDIRKVSAGGAVDGQKVSWTTLAKDASPASLADRLASVTFQHQKAVLVATSVHRLIDIQDSAKAKVVDSYVIENKGAKIQGEFSRLDYLRKQWVGNSVSVFDLNLPLNVGDLHYIDEIGNISVSTVFSHADHVQVSFAPRYPLFGGWRTSFEIGYSVPASGIFTSLPTATQALLSLPTVEQVAVEKIAWTVLLPQGSSPVGLRGPSDWRQCAVQLSAQPVPLDWVSRPRMSVSCEVSTSAPVGVQFPAETVLVEFTEPGIFTTFRRQLVLSSITLLAIAVAVVLTK